MKGGELLKSKLCFLLTLFFLMFRLASCRGDEIKLKLSESCEIEFNEGVRYYIEYVDKNDDYFTIKVIYTGTSDNNYEFVIKDTSAISYEMVGDEKIEAEQVQSFILTPDQYVIPYFERKVEIDIYYSNPSIDSDHSSIVIARSLINNNPHYKEYSEIYNELTRYGILIRLR